MLTAPVLSVGTGDGAGGRAVVTASDRDGDAGQHRQRAFDGEFAPRQKVVLRIASLLNQQLHSENVPAVFAEIHMDIY